MYDLEINLITNMGSSTGIGSYASEIYRMLHKSCNNVNLYSVHYVEGNSVAYSSNLSKFYAKNLLEIPIKNKLNFYMLKKAKIFKNKNIHLLGNDYSLASVSNNVVATIHEYYFTINGIFNSRKLKNVLIEMGYNYGLLKLHFEMGRFNKIIAPSKYSANQIKYHTGIISEVIHETVDENKFHYRNKKISRRILRLPEDKFLILNVSNGGINKNLSTLEKIADFLPKNFKILKIGEPLKSENTINIPHLPDKYYPLLFNASDIYSNVSINEGFNIPLLEAMKSSLPIISNKCSTAPELLGNEGIFVDNPFDIMEYINLIKTVNCVKTLNYYSEMSKRRSSYFSEEKSREKYLKVYSQSFDKI